jgi:hypothetical protein
MKIWLKSIAGAIAFAGMILSAPHAYAGCGIEGLQSGTMTPMPYLHGAAGAVLLTHFAEPGDPFGAAPITGLWKFTFTAEGNSTPPADGTPVDAGFVVWHDDGTEIMNSGRAPVSSNFCLGVWKRVGESTYHLNHWALSWLPDYVPGVTSSFSSDAPQPPASVSENELLQPAGPTNIQEVITLDRSGDHYSGTFRITNYAYDGVNITDAITVKQVIVGTVSATRIDVE